MSDWTDEIKGYEDRNYESLMEEFIEKYDREWQEFVWEKFFGEGIFERYGVRED